MNWVIWGCDHNCLTTIQRPFDAYLTLYCLHICCLTDHLLLPFSSAMLAFTITFPPWRSLCLTCSTLHSLCTHITHYPISLRGHATQHSPTHLVRLSTHIFCRTAMLMIPSFICPSHQPQFLKKKFLKSIPPRPNIK